MGTFMGWWQDFHDWIWELGAGGLIEFGSEG
ncbi:hypothetical protein LCGC14_1619650 [marine sediment metagenome]|uniref:Uncharacterized protein n=1 Tax=marine sediment metagenome TaxID=412755 RepID=A0A0F9I654_9ZZZZ